MPRVFLPQILWHSKDNKRCDRVYSIDFQPKPKEEAVDRNKNTTTLRLATGGADEFVHIWQITIQDHAPQYTNFLKQNPEVKTDFEQPLSIKILARLVGHIGEVNSVRWSHDGRVLASGGEDRCIFLWVKGNKQGNLNEDSHNDYEEYWTRTHYFRLSNVVNTICWCPDDRILSVSTEDGHVSLVDTQVEGTGKIRYFDGHTSFAQGVSLDPKNELLASLGSDQCLRVWKRRNQKQWKNVLVLKAARDRGDLVTVNELENNFELRKYSRYVFMSEELKTFFRRLDWSPDGRLLVAPTGIRHKNNPANTFTTNTNNTTTTNTSNTTWNNPAGNNTTAAGAANTTAATEGQDTNNPSEHTDNTVYTLYVFHRKLLNFGIPMLTHQSPTGPFVVVKFCPIYLSLFDKKRQNFYNLLLNANKNKMKPIKKKLDRISKSQTTLVNKINTYFTSVGGGVTGDNKGVVGEDAGPAESAANEGVEATSQEDPEDELAPEEDDEDDEILTMLEENEHDMNNPDNTTTNTEYNSDTFNLNTDRSLDYPMPGVGERSLLNYPDLPENDDANEEPDDLMHDDSVDNNLTEYREEVYVEPDPLNVTEDHSETNQTNGVDTTFEGTSVNKSEHEPAHVKEPKHAEEEEPKHVEDEGRLKQEAESLPAGDEDDSMVKDELEPVLIKEEAEASQGSGNDHEPRAPVKEEDDMTKDQGVKEDDEETVNDAESPRDGEPGAKTEEDAEAEEGEKEDEKKVYNLRTKRKSVIPLLFENYASVPKKPRVKGTGEKKKKKAEDDLQEEDYDTDLEEELSVPRFLFAAGTTDGSLCFFDTKENSGPIAVLKNLHFCPITDISWSPDGYVCATSSSDGYITFVIFNKRELS